MMMIGKQCAVCGCGVREGRLGVWEGVIFFLLLYCAVGRLFVYLGFGLSCLKYLLIVEYFLFF